jgi:hypothetical protein
MRGFVIPAVLIGLLALPGSASAAPTCSGAERAAEHTRAYYLNEEGQFHCRFTGPSRFDVAFASRPGYGPSWEVTVWYTHRHYVAGIPRLG